MRFYETNRICGVVFFDVTISVCDSSNDVSENLNPVRLAKPNPFFARFARGKERGGYGWALDSLHGSDIVNLESDKICRI